MGDTADHGSGGKGRGRGHCCDGERASECRQLELTPRVGHELTLWVVNFACRTEGTRGLR